MAFFGYPEAHDDDAERAARGGLAILEVLIFVNDTRFTFKVAAGAVPGPSYVQALNPPFVPLTSSGTGPG
jgi:hypothetical protein